MTIQGSGVGTRLVIGAAAVYAVFGIVIATVIGRPQLLLFAAFPAIAGVAVALVLLRPVSLTAEAGDLVYRSGGSETRVARTRIASCSLGRRSWDFRDASGAILISLLAIRFSADDVLAFCQQAGIQMTGPVQKPVDQLRQNLKSGKWMRLIGIVSGVGWLAMLAATVVIAAQARQDLAGYQAASACATAAPATGCRFEGKATVTGVDGEKSYDLVHLALAGNGASYQVDVNFAPPSQGAVVDVEVWNRRVTLIDGLETNAYPASNPNLDDTGAFAGFGAFILLSVGVAIGGQYQMRNARVALAGAGSPA